MQINYRNLRILRDKAVVRFFGFPRFYSIVCTDVTNRCTLRCKGCYYFGHNLDKVKELSKEEWLSVFKEAKKKHRWINYAAWVGGEPLLRKDMLFEATKLFGHNMIVTNGTLSLVAFPNTVYIVSMDGTKEFDEEIRGAGHYELAKKNIREFSGKVSLNMTINKKSQASIEAFADEWRKEPNVKQIYFSFHTPQKGADDELWTGWELRDEIIERLKELKKKHGKFVMMSEKELDLMKSDVVRKTLIPNCVCRSGLGLVMSADGKKRTCVLGDTADCERCGNWEMMHATSIVLKPDWKTIDMVFDLFGANIK